MSIRDKWRRLVGQDPVKACPVDISHPSHTFKELDCDQGLVTKVHRFHCDGITEESR